MGVDNAAPSERAVEWVCANALLDRDELLLVAVEAEAHPDEAVPEWLGDLASRFRRRHPGLRVTARTATGHPVPCLVEISRRSTLLAVGSRGHGAFHDALLGSVALGVAMRSACPAVVVRGETERVTHETVVVGIDGSAAARRALEFACRTAEALRCDLMAVQASPDAYFIPGPYEHPDREELLGRAERLLAEELAGTGPEHPDLVLRGVTSSMNPIDALAEAASGARLLVVGHRGAGGFSEMLLGSVSRGVLHRSPCPVAVVPGTRDFR
ncbi:nucleotide-binding universal stress UspA family protein [Saccharopolyspora gloriosae]|uniref:Nucleotide-binding universal stress UspA family protein n=1 Tax=Saccharopolyspora gloriosae TaxID=455344 RepID=A0A840NL25_9PSEU|nr:nucleotide-binding universal stress UspA family protein [Saccharopolyspora gloriosae]